MSTKLVSLVRRQSSQDIGHATLHHKLLSPFQVEKFRYMFKAFFDLDKNNLIEAEDVTRLVEKIRLYCAWSKDDETFRVVEDVLKTFLDCLREQVETEKLSDAESEVIPSWKEALKPTKVDTSSVTMDQWLNMWGRLCYGSAGLKDFPCWAQLLPSVFFKVIDNDKDGVLSIEEYRRFYKEFIGIPDERLEKTVQAGYNAMTADGEYKLTADNFDFCFANFLLGRQIYGPGKYIFGVFDNRDIDEKFEVLYNVEEDEE